MNNNLNFYKITFITIIIIILLMQIYVLFLLLLFYNLFIRTLEIYRSEDKSIMFVMCRSNKGWSVLCWRNGMHGEISFLSHSISLASTLTFLYNIFSMNTKFS